MLAQNRGPNEKRLAAMLAGGLLFGGLVGCATTAEPPPNTDSADAYAIVDCDIGIESLRNCVVVEENPPGEGFGQAALEIIRKQQLSSDNRPGEGKARVKIPFWRN